jgi:hypothetical protein
MRKLLQKQGFVPDAFVADKLPSCGAALKDMGLSKHHDIGAERTIWLRTLTCQFDNANDEYNGSSRPDQRNGFCPPTLLSTTPLTSNAISSPA